MMRKKLYNSLTQRWVYSDGPSARRYLSQISASQVLPHPACAEDALIVIDCHGRPIATPLPPKIAEPDEAPSRQPFAAVEEPPPSSAQRRSVRFDPSAKTHDGMSADNRFLEDVAALLMRQQAASDSELEHVLAQALQVVSRGGAVDVAAVLRLVVDVVNRAHESQGRPVFVINVGGGAVMYDASDPHHQRVVRVLMKALLERLGTKLSRD